MSRDFVPLVFRIAVPLFVLLVVLRDFGLFPAQAFLPFLGLVVVALSLVAVTAHDPAGDERRATRSWIAPTVVLVGFAFGLTIRFAASLKYPVLLGYDPGLYRSLLDTYLSALPNIPEAHLAEWLRSGYPQGLPVLVDLLHTLGQVTADGFMRILFPVVSAAVALPLYLLARDLYGRRAAMISTLLYAVSYTAVYTFGLMYLKNVVGLFLLLLAFHALTRRRHALFGILLGGVGFYHRPTFLLGVLVAVAVLVATRDRRMIPALLVSAVIAGPPMLLRFNENFALLRDMAGSGALASPALGGTFFNLEAYRWASLGYQPFALIAALHDVRDRRWTVGLLWLAVASALVVYEVYFFNRFIIPLDIGMLLLAGRGIDLSLRYLGQRRRWAAVSGVSAVVLVGAVVPSWRYTRGTSPLITEHQLQAIEWIRDHSPSDAVVIASAYDAPWAEGWSGRRVIAPGLFDDTRYSEDQWIAFLHTEDAVDAARFVSAYGPPVYVYYSGEPGSVMDAKKFVPPEFELVHSEGGAEVFTLATQPSDQGSNP